MPCSKLLCASMSCWSQPAFAALPFDALPGPAGLPCLQDRRVIEYVVLGDYPTAVGFLLASKPERTARYYRDALCTLALAVRPWLGICMSAMRDHKHHEQCRHSTLLLANWGLA